MMEGTKKKGLGRGLGALIRETAPAAVRPAERSLDVDLIRPNPFQPRRHFDDAAIAEMAQSIREQGVVQPLLVRRRGEDYELVAGERRLRAARLAGLESVPVVVREMSDREALEIALVENLQRADLTPLEEAAAYARLADEFELTQEEVAKRVGKSRPAVANTIRLLDLPEAVLDELRAGNLTAGHARALLALRSASDQIALAKEAVRLRLSVRQLEARVASRPEPAAVPRPARATTPEVADAERQLMRSLGTKVRIRSSGKRGRIVIEFHSLDEFDRIFTHLRGGSRL
jgi:ParB family chromosome partitioning protein